MIILILGMFPGKTQIYKYSLVILAVEMLFITLQRNRRVVAKYVLGQK